MLVFSGRSRGTLAAVAVCGVTLALGVSSCARRVGRGWFGWASVPACQSVIRARALSEFGRKFDVRFDGAAEERRLHKNRLRVEGRARVEREGAETIRLAYECVTNPPRSKILSATYRAAD
jgi:hypothetical protein